MNSSFTDIFIRRPVLAIVVSLVIIIAGTQAILAALSGKSGFTVRQYPRSENSVVTVSTAYVGANADLVRGFITTPLERAIAAADGIEYIESQSAQGFSSISARLKINYEPTKALAEISSKVDQVRGDLPPGAEVPIINVESADSRFASAYIRFTSDLLAHNEITDYLIRVVQPRLSAVEGVQRAEIMGGRTFAMRIWLKPDRMAAYNISPAQVRQALAANNYLAALGQTRGALIQVNLTANTDLRSADEFKQLVIREEHDAIIRLEDIADVVLGADNYDSEVRFSGQTAVFMGIFVLPTANSIEVIKRARAELEQIQKELPTGLDGGIAYDSTEYINNAINEVVSTLLETLLIVVIVIFFFLGTFRSVLVPVVTIPVSLIGAVFLMQILGFSINLLTLLAIVLSVGLVVDDAIVVVENVERHMREGKTPFDAAILGARELVGPIIAMTITLAAVYAPIGLQGGLTGSLFREFAFTLAGAVMISGVVALTLSPMMSAKLLDEKIEHHWLPTRINATFEKLRNAYARVLDSALSVRPAVYMVWVMLTLLTIPMWMFSANELAPTEDQGIIFGIAEASANSTIDQTRKFSHAAHDVFMEVPERKFVFQHTGSNSGFAGLVLAPWSERERTAFEIMPQLHAKLAQIPGIQMFPAMPSALPGGGQLPVEFIIASTADVKDILEIAEQIRTKVMASGKWPVMLIDVKIDQPQSELVIDRNKVAALGLNLQQIGADVSAMIGGNYVNRFSIDGRSYKVIPQVQRAGRLNPDQIEDIYVTGPNNQLIPLSTVASIRSTTQPRSLNRFQQLNSVKLTAAYMGPLDEALRTLEDEAAQVLPKGYVIDYTGESRQLRQEGGSKFGQTMLLALALIFLVLAAQFNSFRDPFIILLGSVPLAMFGALLFTFIKMPMSTIPFWTDGFSTSLNIYSKIGLVTLIGLIAKNGILIVEFANVLQREGKSKLAAVREASLTRLRPILMTSAATIAGHFPLTLVTGAGAAARNSIGLVLVGGIAVGTFFTLFVVPALYMLIAKDHSAGLPQKTVQPATQAAH